MQQEVLQPSVQWQAPQLVMPQHVPQPFNQQEILQPSVQLQAPQPPVQQPAQQQLPQYTAQQEMAYLTKLLIQQQVRAALPEQTISKFDGDPLKYTNFIKEFEYSVEDKTENSRDRLSYLAKYTSGEANVLVRSCLHYADSTEGYLTAKTLLRKKYGDPMIFAQAIQKRAVNWTEIKEHDANELSKFALFLLEAENTMKNIQALNELNPSAVFHSGKLPYRLRGAWRSKVYEIEEERGQTVTFHDFVHFTDKHAKMMTNPVFGGIQSAPQGEAGSKGKPKGNNNFKKPVRGLATSTGQKSLTKPNESTDTKNCEFCKGTSHKLETCFKLAKLSIEERLKFVREQKMCFGCLKKGKHFSKDCKNRLECKECKKGHPTVLHHVKSMNPGATHEDAKATKTACGRDAGAGAESCPIITPVTVYSKDTDLDRKNIIDLPRVYTQAELPASVDDVVTHQDVETFDYLKEVKLPDMQHVSDAHVGLLIGNSVPSATEPLEVINSVDNGPYAVKTLLGWCVHGVPKSRTTKRIFRVKVNSIEEQFQQLYNHEFPERLINDTPQLSGEDVEFLSKVNSTTKLVDGHYEMGLPIRNPDKEFINNINQAEQRAAHLKKRFEKDPKYHEKYKQCMNEMLQKNYAEEVAEDELISDRVWYIPHHGVVHQQKGKLRVVFDCGATFMGQSLNSRLLQGPDLTNNLTGVLLRFRQYPIAVIGDIEAMYYQVHAS
ncbi:uncharacterized protein [Amphiura filiformis]|uniref:uncharacterized protein n=1 Tax=Amphiura filiformis TaxID=82378 RepID=UPI003B2165FD